MRWHGVDSCLEDEEDVYETPGPHMPYEVYGARQDGNPKFLGRFSSLRRAQDFLDATRRTEFFRHWGKPAMVVWDQRDPERGDISGYDPDDEETRELDKGRHAQ